jgi:hypothetical protein
VAIRALHAVHEVRANEDRGIDPVDDGRAATTDIRPAQRTNHARERIIGARE